MLTLLAAFYLALVDSSRLDAEARAPQPLPAAIDARLACAPGVPSDVRLEEARDEGGRRVLRGNLSFRRQGTDDLRRADFDYYRAGGESDACPVVVISPITGGNYEVSRMIAADLAEHGYHAVIVKRPANERAIRRQAELENLEEAMRDAIAARRRVIDWLETRPEVDAQRIGAYGVSLGGVITATLAAVDERIAASVVVMGCGDLPALLCRSIEPGARRLARAYGVPDNPAPADLAAFEKLARPILVTDPQLLAPHVDPREVFLVMTRRDESVPTVLQERLHEALGSPESISLPTGHYSAVLYLPVILESGRRFLERRFRQAAE